MILLNAFEALGTYWWITLYDEPARSVIPVLQESVMRNIRSFEKDYSRFLPDSILSRLNSARSLSAAPPDLIEMIRISLKLGEVTHGLFSLGVGGMLEERGYDRTYSFSPKKKHLEAPVTPVITGKAVCLPGEGNLDLGGIGKGYLIGKLADYFKRNGIPYFMINGGGDIYATSDHGKPVNVYLQHPFMLDTVFADIALHDAAVCVSSPAKRQWKDAKTARVFTHILNPLSPDADISTITGSVVIGKDPAIADALATVFCIMDEAECKKTADRFGVRYRKISAQVPQG